MVKLYLIRHGEAEGNLYRRMAGNRDSALTELGWRQIAALGNRFADIPLDGVYSSDLCRAMETGAVLCRQKGLPLHTDRRLREVNVGPWEDQPFGTVAADHPEEMRLFSQDPQHWHLSGADTYEGVADRAVAALTDIVTTRDGQTVAVCAHGFLIRAVLSKLFYGMDHPELTGRSTNTAVTLMTWEQGRFSLEYQNDASHLDSSLLRIPSLAADLCIRPMGADAAEEYIRYRQDAWQVVYGDLKGFNGSGFWLDAQRTIGNDPMAMVVGYLDRTPVGMIQLNPSRDEKKGVGYIPFLCLREPYRHKGLGIQFIGHAVSFYRKLGRTKLQLSVAPTNTKALGFYAKFGFHQVRKQKGRFGHLLLLEKDIAPPTPPKDITIESV